MGIYANYTNGKLTISSDPVTINGVTYDPETHKEDIKGFKWFKKKWLAKDYFIKTEGQEELHKATLSNDKVIYVVGEDEFECRDKISEYLSERFFAGSPEYIISMEHIADLKTKGFVPKLIL